MPGAGDRGSTLCGEVKVAIGVKKSWVNAMCGDSK